MTFEQLHQQLQNDPWWQEVFGEFERQQMLMKLNKVVKDSHKSAAVGAMLERIHIDSQMLEHAGHDPTYQEAHSLLSGLKAGEEYPERLLELYDSRVPTALARINQAALDLIPLLTDLDILADAQRLWTANRNELRALDLSRLPRNLNVRTPDERYVLRALVELAEKDDLFRNYKVYPFSSKEYIPTLPYGEDIATEVNADIDMSGFREQLKYVAYRVYDPLWDRMMERYEPEYVTFRLKWAGGALNISDMMNLYKLHRKGKDVQSAFISLYKDPARLDRLKEAVASCPVTQSYTDLFAETIESYLDERFKISSVALLPMIEGVIWEYAWWWHDIHGCLLDRTVSYEEYKGGIGFELLRPDGTRAGGRPNIGQLLRQTKFGDDVYLEVVEYLCEELFEERNPVLHGRDPRYGNGSKASSLLFVVEVLERTITAAFKAHVSNVLLKAESKVESETENENPE